MKKKLPGMNGLSLVPVSSEAPEWAETVTERIYDMVGMAKVIANYADDLPRADVAMTERAVKVKKHRCCLWLQSTRVESGGS